MAPKSPDRAPTGDDEQQAKRAKILEIQRDASLSDAEKNRRIQALHGAASKWLAPASDEKDPLEGLTQAERDSVTCGICFDMVSRPVTMPCQHNMCLDCLKGIRRMEVAQRKCPYCRKEVSAAFIDSARINMTIVSYIRMLRARCGGRSTVVTARVHRESKEEEERPEEAFVTDRAKRKGMANACSGSLKMTCPQDHFGPIGAEYDPRRNRGLVVGDMFPNRMACRMWNAHLPHVAGIAGQGSRGAQSVVLSGGYEDDVDEGDYFLYTGSGGKDLSGNKRNGAHDKDQEFTRYNLALMKSCEEGLPVRVIRSHKEKRSAYAPKPEAIKELQNLLAKNKGDKGKGKARRKSAKAGGSAGKDGEVSADDEEEEDEEEEEQDGAAGAGSGGEQDEEEDEDDDEEEGEGEEEEEGGEREEAAGGSKAREIAKAKAFNPVRYDGIYRVLACWRAKGAANYLVCRYLFVRCDNTPAPWSSDDSGDKPRTEIPPRAAKEIAQAKELGEEVTYITKTPFWDYNSETGEWGWAKPPPVTRGKTARAPKQEMPLEKKLEAAQRELKRQTKQLKEAYGCTLCQQVATRPVYTPCGHRFCLDCLKGKLDGGDGQARHNSRPSRSASQRKPCPARGCGKDLVAFMRDVQVNTTMAAQAEAAVEGVKRKEAEVDALQRKVDGREEEEEEEEPAAEAEAAPQEEDQAPQENAAEAAAEAAEDAAAQQDDAMQQQEPEKAPAAAAADEAMPDAAAAEPAAASAGELAGGGSSRWQAAATSLALRHPDFDAALISGLLEDQGGDEVEVDAYLKRMKRDQQRANKSPVGKGAAAAGGSKRGGKKSGARGGKPKAAVVEAEKVEENLAQEEQDEPAAAGEEMEMEEAEKGKKRSTAGKAVAKGTKAAAVKGEGAKAKGKAEKAKGDAEPAAVKRRKVAA